MDLQPSILKLTHDPGGSNSVLLEHGWWLDGPIKFPLINGTEVVPTPDSNYPLILNTLNSQFTMKFTVVRDDLASPKDAIIEVLTWMGYMVATQVKPLLIEVQGHTANTWTVAQCRVSEHEPYHLPTKDGKVWTLKSFTLVCAGLAVS